MDQYFNSLQHNNLDQRYCHEPIKIILIMHPNKFIARELFGWFHGFKVCTGAQYLSGYIGDDGYKGGWIQKRTEKWEREICVLRKTVEKYIQDGCAVEERAIQLEWIFFATREKRYRTGIFGDRKISAGDLFALSLFVKQKNISPIKGALSTFLLKKNWLGLQNIVTPSKDKYNSLLHVSCKLIGAVKGKRDFSTANYIRAVKGERQDSKKTSMPLMAQNSREWSAIKTPLKNAFYYASNTWVPVWAHRVPRLLVQYPQKRNYAIFMCLLQI